MKKIVITGLGMNDAYGFDPATCFLRAINQDEVLPRRVKDVFDISGDPPVKNALIMPSMRSEIIAADLEYDYGVPIKEARKLLPKTAHGLRTALFALKNAGIDIHDKKNKNITLVSVDSPRNDVLQPMIEASLTGRRLNPHHLLSFRPDYLVDFISSTFGLTAPGCRTFTAWSRA